MIESFSMGFSKLPTTLALMVEVSTPIKL